MVPSSHMHQLVGLGVRKPETHYVLIDGLWPTISSEICVRSGVFEDIEVTFQATNFVPISRSSLSALSAPLTQF